MLLTRFAAVAALLGFCLAASAQDGPSAKEIILGRRVFVTFRKEVRVELKITDAQNKKIIDAFEGTVEVDGDSIMIQLTGDQDLKKLEANAIKVLDEVQRKRLEELWLQSVGAYAAGDDTIAKALSVTAEQTKKIDKIFDDTKDEILDLYMSGHSEDNVKKGEAIRDSGRKLVEAILTKEQIKMLEDMKGKPFKFKKDGC